MGEHPNAAKMREAAGKFVAGDLDGFMATFSDDIVWRSGGSSVLSGTYKGKDEVAGWFGKIREFAGDTIDVEPVDVLADDAHLTIFLRITDIFSVRPASAGFCNRHRKGSSRMRATHANWMETHIFVTPRVHEIPRPVGPDALNTPGW